MTQVLEWAPFQVLEGVTDAAVIAASQKLQQEFLSQQPGFVRRELLRAGADRWVDLVHWQNRAAADKAMEVAPLNAACQAYFSLMVPPQSQDLSQGVLHLDQVQTFAAEA